jgi:polyphosphate glucokinase
MTARKILVIDVGGAHVKIKCTGHGDIRKVKSGPKMTPEPMIKYVLKMAKDWKFDGVSIGYPGPARHGKPTGEPPNLGKGWIGFDYAGAFGCEVKFVNDALMQAIGSYEGGRMLFLGLGTGLGSAMILDNVGQPMELAHLPYKDDRSFEDFVGERGLERFSLKTWKRHVVTVIELLQAATEPDYVVIGGGNVRRLKTLPAGCRRGNNDDAFRGGFRLWKKRGVLV